ncbi:MAG: hypothetical protein KF688_16205 [Pirellulales bacterium]|nr:hypothetical protein [Pirellulales bacterium]
MPRSRSDLPRDHAERHVPAVVCDQFLCGAFGITSAIQERSRPFLACGLLATLCPLVALMLRPPRLRQIRLSETSPVRRRLVAVRF